MQRPKWVFQTTPKMGGATGEAYANPLQGTGMRASSVLAREAIQNSVDAHRPEGKVRIEFRRLALRGKRKLAFVQALALDPAIRSRKGVLQLPRASCLETLKDATVPLSLFFIEDYNTHGLCGDPHASDSHFFRLLLSLGDGSKARAAAESGGSFGFGKAVYSSNSRIRTVVAYSAFDPVLGGGRGRNHARLMGCSYFNTHKIGREAFSGRAWFGLESSKEPGVVDPLTDEDAHAVAETLGFRTRSSKDTGTSLMLVDCCVDMEELCEAIEDWWWPRLLDDGLDIALFEEERRLRPPRPKKRKDLAPFIDAYELAVGRSLPTGKHQKADQFNKYDGVPLGRYGFVVVDNDAEVEPRVADRLDTVALIRGPRMVVSYMPAGGTQPIRCVGAFVAAPEIDQRLRLSEPPEHNRWDTESTRLDTLGENTREIVRAVLQRVKQRMRAFATDATPPAPKQELRLRSLERLLGGLFRLPGARNRTDGLGHRDPIEIRFLEQPHIVPIAHNLATRGAFRVGLSEECTRERIPVRVRVRCLVQEDEGFSTEDPIPMLVESDGTECVRNKEHPSELRLTLTREQSATFTFRTEAYNSDWTTRIEVEVEEA